LPFTNPRVAEYFAKMPEPYLYDRRNLKNKLILRELLKKRIGLDSDAIGKKGFSYDYRALMKENWDWFMDEIRSCRFWDKAGLEMVLPRLERAVLNGHRRAFMAEHLIYRLYLISAWFNHNKYVNAEQ
jgi:asparagine synthase (glutamine-hydrolysing)